MMGQHDHISVLYFNVRSLIPKFDNLCLICASLCPSFVCVVESWLSSEIDDSEISIQGYNVVRLDSTRHGGVIYVHDMFSYSVLFKGSPDFELLTLSCKSPINNPDFYLALFIDHPVPIFC